MKQRTLKRNGKQAASIDYVAALRQKVDDLGYRRTGLEVANSDSICIELDYHGETRVAEMLIGKNRALDAYNAVAWSHTWNAILHGPGVGMVSDSPLQFIPRTIHETGQIHGSQWVTASPVLTQNLTMYGAEEDGNVYMAQALADLAIRIMNQPLKVALPIEGGTSFFAGGVRSKQRLFRGVIEAFQSHEDLRLARLMESALPLAKLSTYYPMHGSLRLDALHTPTAIAPTMTLSEIRCYVIGGEAARKDGIPFMDVASLHFDIYQRWGSIPAEQFLFRVMLQLNDEQLRIYLEYFPQVCAFYTSMMIGSGMPVLPRYSEYLDALLD